MIDGIDRPDQAGAALFRADVRAVLGGIPFSLAFTGLVWRAGGRLDSVRLLPDQRPA